jgi:hypothetical protein
MKDCECVYRIYIGKNKEKAQDRLIEKYQEFVASGAKEIIVKVDETIMEGGNSSTYPYRPFEKAMNYIIRPVSERDDNNSAIDGKDNESVTGRIVEQDQENWVDGNDGNDSVKDTHEKEDIEKEKEVNNIQDIREFYSKLSCGVGVGVGVGVGGVCGVVCVCVCVCGGV